MEISTEILHKEIDLIQANISRMAKNSFSLKGLYVTLLTATFGLFSNQLTAYAMALVVVLLSVCFWLLDAFYLYLERLYIEKYNWVIKARSTGSLKYLYDLNPHEKETRLTQNSKKLHYINALISPSVLSLYGGLMLAMIFIA